MNDSFVSVVVEKIKIVVRDEACEGHDGVVLSVQTSHLNVLVMLQKEEVIIYYLAVYPYERIFGRHPSGWCLRCRILMVVESPQMVEHEKGRRHNGLCTN